MAAVVSMAVAAGALTLSTLPATAAAPAAVVHRKHSPASFTVSSFNVLGGSHTKHSKRFTYGTTRIVWANQLLERHSVDVAGLQEFQVPQLRKFMQITKNGWGAYPGLSMKPRDSENSIIWRKSMFDLLDATTVNIPYFDGQPRAMPVVLLRHKATGAMFYYANFHNPAETAQFHHQGIWRVRATNIEVKLQRQLSRTRIARIMTGDMNERGPYFCRVSGASSIKAARPGTFREGGRRTGACRDGKPRAVDWILGSPHATFWRYFEDRGPLVDKTTDHPVITSAVTIDPTQLPKSYGAVPAHLVPERSWGVR